MRVILFSIILFFQVSLIFSASPYSARRDDIIFGEDYPQWNWRENIKTTGDFCSVMSRDSALSCTSNRYSSNAIRAVYYTLADDYTTTEVYTNFNTVLENFFIKFPLVITDTEGNTVSYWSANDLIRLYNLAGDEFTKDNSSRFSGKMSEYTNYYSPFKFPYNSIYDFETKISYTSFGDEDKNATQLVASYLFKQSRDDLKADNETEVMNYLFDKSIDGLQEFNSKYHGTRISGSIMNLRDFADSNKIRFRADVFERIELLEQVILQVNGYSNLTSFNESTVGSLTAWDGNRTKFNHVFFGEPEKIYDPMYWYWQFGDTSLDEKPIPLPPGEYTDRPGDDLYEYKPDLGCYAVTMPLHLFSDFPKTIFNPIETLFSSTTPIIANIRVNKSLDSREMEGQCYVYRTPEYCLSTFQYTGGSSNALQMVNFDGERAYITPLVTNVPYSFGWRNIALWSVGSLAVGYDMGYSDIIESGGKDFYCSDREDAYVMYCSRFKDTWSLVYCGRQSDNPDNVRTFRTYDEFKSSMDNIAPAIISYNTDIPSSEIIIPINLIPGNSYYNDKLVVHNNGRTAEYYKNSTEQLTQVYNYDDVAYKKIDAWEESGTSWDAQSKIITTTWESADSDCNWMKIDIDIVNESSLQYSLSGRYSNFNDSITYGNATYDKNNWPRGNNKLTLLDIFGIRKRAVATPDTLATYSLGTDVIWSTFFGGTGSGGGASGRGTTEAVGVDVDSSGNIYVAFNTASPNLPVKNAYQSSYSTTYPSKPDGNVYLAKFNSSGSALLYATYFGGSICDFSTGIDALDNGKVWVTGSTFSPDFPTKNPYQASGCPWWTSTDGKYDFYYPNGFVANFDTTKTGDSSLLFSTYFGGTYGTGDGVGEWFRGIKVDSSENCYVAGDVQSHDLPAMNPTYNIISKGGWSDIVLAKYDSSGQMVYCYPMGGTHAERSYGFDLDSSGNCYLTGWTKTPYDASAPKNSFPISANAYDKASRSEYKDNYVARISSGFTSHTMTTKGGDTNFISPQACTFLSAHSDKWSETWGMGVAVDSSNDISCFGYYYDNGNNYPVFSAFSDSPTGNDDIVITKLDTNLSSLKFSTYLGGTGNDEPARNGLVVDSEDRIWITGNFIWGKNFPTTNETFPTDWENPSAFLVSINSDGTLHYSKYFGKKSGTDKGTGIKTDNSYIYFVGSTTSSDFPVKNAYQSTFKGTQDAFIMKIQIVDTAPTPAGYKTPTPTISPIYSPTPTPGGYKTPTPFTTPTAIPTPSPTPELDHYSFIEAGWSEFSRDGWDLKYDTTASFNLYLDSTTLDTPTVFNFSLPTTGKYWGWFRWKGNGQWAEVKTEDELGIFHTTQMRNSEWQWFKDDYDAYYQVNSIINTNYSVTFNVTTGTGWLDGFLLTDDEDFVPEGKMGEFPIAATTTQEVYIYPGIVEGDFFWGSSEFIIRDLWYMPLGDNIIDIQGVPDKEEIAVLKDYKGGYGANNVVEIYNKPKTGDIHKTELHEAVALDAWQVPICSNCRFLLTGDFTGDGTSNIATEAFIDKSYIYWWNLPEREDTTYYMATVTNPYPLSHSN